MNANQDIPAPPPRTSRPAQRSFNSNKITTGQVPSRLVTYLLGHEAAYLSSRKESLGILSGCSESSLLCAGIPLDFTQVTMTGTRNDVTVACPLITDSSFGLGGRTLQFQVLFPNVSTVNIAVETASTTISEFQIPRITNQFKLGWLAYIIMRRETHAYSCYPLFGRIL